MIRVKHSTGNAYYKKEELIAYTTVWNEAMAIKGGMRFYNGDLSLVADFTLGEQPDEILAITYPHNTKPSLIEAATAHEKELRAAIEQAMKQEPERSTFTFDLDGNQVKLLQKEHFNRFGSVASPQDELFTFDNPDPKVGFPRLYLHEKSQRMSETYGEVFRVLSKISRFAFPAMKDEPTTDGKRFSYMLFNSFINLEFMGKVPAMAAVRWPTKLSCELPSYINFSAFDKFLVEAGIDKLVIKDGKLVNIDELIVAELESEDDDLPEFMLDDTDPLMNTDHLDSALIGRVWTMIENKGFFNLGDAFTVGFDRVMALVPISNKIIQANIDFPGLVRKMCIYQGMFHILPLAFNDDVQRLAEILDMDEDMMKLCTDETYPNNTNPLLPAPEY